MPITSAGTATGVSFSGAGTTSNSVSFTANFTNTSANNVQTWQIREGSSNDLLATGTIPAGGSASPFFSSGNVYQPGDSGSYKAIRISQIGNVFTATLTFTTDVPSPPPPPPPATPAPVFSDATVATGLLGKSYSDGVTANNTTSYAIAAGGSLPAGLSLNTTTGAITGTPTQQGSFTFAVNATGAGGTTGSGNLTIQVLPPGNRRNSSDFSSNLAVARRYNGTSWVNLTTMKRFNGTAWVDISN